jgi:threonine dehydrogenase-like Zn-dependent dehydrogenase
VAEQAVAAVLTCARSLELTELPLPSISTDDALLRVEACGMCGTDVEQYRGGLNDTLGLQYPLIPGHEVVGVVHAIGLEAAKRWGVREGDRVAVEPFVPCNHCAFCHAGTYQYCRGWGRIMCYGMIPTAVSPALWGGYSTHMYLPPNTIIHKVPDHIEATTAALFNPLGAGIRWGVTLAGTTIGSKVVILGPGQRGIACAIAAKLAGAALVIISGLSRDRHKLDLALSLGADVAIDVEKEDLVPRVRELTNGGADIVIDVSASATQPVLDAVACVRAAGTIVLAGLKGRGVPDFPADKVAVNGITVIGASGVTSPGYRDALAVIGAQDADVERMRTHTFPLADAALAVRTLAGEEDGEAAINVIIAPNS